MAIIKTKTYNLQVIEGSSEDAFIASFFSSFSGYLIKNQEIRDKRKNIFRKKLISFMDLFRQESKENINIELKNARLGADEISYMAILEDIKHRFAEDKEKIVMDNIINKAKKEYDSKKVS